MLKTTLKPRRVVLDRAKATPTIAFAFFIVFALGHAGRAASTNWVDGTAYGTNYSGLATSASISSVSDGSGSLAIGYDGTTDLTISHDVEGFIIVSNRIDGFTLDATDGSVTGSQYAVLTVLGGSNLTISGGQFTGTEGSAGIIVPPIPGQGTQTNAVSSAAVGGVLYGVTNVAITGTTFAGATYSPNNQYSIGTDGLQLIGSGAVAITNATVSGGDAAAADSGVSLGGHALYVQDTDVVLVGGSYTGGSSGTADVSFGGTALFATNASVVIDGGAQLAGGNDAEAVYLRNSNLMLNDGIIQGGLYGTNEYFGLVSIADTGKTSRIELNDGYINSIDFAGDGAQAVTIGTGLSVGDFIVVDGGSITVTNLSNTPLQHTFVRDGSIAFVNGFDLLSGGDFTLDSASSQASFSSLSVYSNATLWAGLGTIDVSTDFTLSEGGILSFLIVTNEAGRLNAASSTFETNSTIRVYANQAAFSYGTNYVLLVKNSDSIAGTSNINFEVTTSGRTIYNGLASTSSGDDLVASFITQTLKEYWSATGQFADLAGELENNAQMALLIDQYDDPEASALAVEQTYFTTFNNLQTALQGMRSSVGQSISRGSEFREQLKLVPRRRPRGARGPARQNNLRGWIKYYGHYLTHDQEGINPEYDSRLHGGTVGVDTSFGNLMLGISGGSSQYRITYDQNALSDTVAYQGNLYGTYGMERAYIDGGIAYGHNQVDTRTADPFVLEGDFEADLASAFLGGGYNLLDTKGGTVFTPEASIQYSMYQQDAYTEESAVAVPRVFDEFDADSLLGTVGLNVAMLKTLRFDTFGLKIDGRMHWMHEFNADPSNMNFMLQGGGVPYQLSYPGLDEDIYRIGIGGSFFNTIRYQPKNVMLRIDFDELFGDGFNSHNISAKLVYAF